MAGQYPSMGYVADSQTVLLRKICRNTAMLVDGGGGGGGGVTQIVAGTNITLSPIGGTGVVTVNSTGGGGGAGVARAAATNNTGNSTITPTASIQKTVLTFTGAARSSIIILDVAGRTAGDKIFLNLVLPVTINIIISVRNATSGGTLLLPVEIYPTQDITTDGNLLSSHLEFTYNGTAWEYDMSNLPA